MGKNLTRKAEEFQFMILTAVGNISVYRSSFCVGVQQSRRKRAFFPVGDLRKLSETLVSEPSFLKTLSKCWEFTELDRGSQVIYSS